MTSSQIQRINAAAFVLVLVSIVCGICIALLGVWGVIAADGVLWKALSTCGIIFAGSILSSQAIRCFKANEEP